jgi:hypothetical protein
MALDGGNGRQLWEGLRTDELRVKLDEAHAKLVKLEKPRSWWRTAAAGTLLALIVTAITAYVSQALWDSVVSNVRAGRVERDDFDVALKANTTTHKSITKALSNVSTRGEVVDDRTDLLQQVLIDKVPRDVARRNILKKQQAREAALAAQPDEETP